MLVVLALDLALVDLLDCTSCVILDTLFGRGLAHCRMCLFLCPGVACCGVLADSHVQFNLPFFLAHFLLDMIGLCFAIGSDCSATLGGGWASRVINRVCLLVSSTGSGSVGGVHDEMKSCCVCGAAR